MAKVWALEPYYGGSHQQFLDGLARHSAHDFTLLTLPGRHWKWRMHGGALEIGGAGGGSARARRRPPGRLLRLGHARSAGVSRDGRGAAAPRAALARIPAIAYFHENQLTYPLPPGVERDLGYGFKNLTTALAAETVLFNSEYHRREFLAAAEELMAGMPDAVPAWAVEEVAAQVGGAAAGMRPACARRGPGAGAGAGGGRLVRRSRPRGR